MTKARTDMLQTIPISKLIMKQSIPSFIGIISYNLYNVVNTIYLSRGIGANAAGGAAITFPLFIFLAAVGSTLGAGAASIISRAIGEHSIEKASKVAANTFITFWLIALQITFWGLLYMDPILRVMGVTDLLLPYARSYSKIILIGAITSTGFSSLIRAEGSSKYAMYQWLIPIVVNFFLDPVFIFGLQMGIRGAALATVLSQCVSMVMFANYYFFSGRTHLDLKARYFIPDLKIMYEICLIGLPTFIQMASQSFAIIVINNILKNYGGEFYITTYGIVNKIVLFLIIPVQGIVQGIQPIIGYNYGAGLNNRVREALKAGSKIAGVYGASCSIVVILLSRYLLYPFTSEAPIIQTGSDILQIICIGTAFMGIQMIQVTYFQAIGKSIISLLLSLCNYMLCFVPLLFLCSRLGGVQLIWYAFPLSNLLSCCISSVCVIYLSKEKIHPN